MSCPVLGVDAAGDGGGARPAPTGRPARENSGPQMMTVGMATRRPSASVVPSSALTALIAISGPGCGGTRPCSTDRPASAGMAMRISGIFERWVTRTITGSSSTSPISKNIGRPMITATSVIDQASLFPVALASRVSTTRFGAAGVGEQLAQHRAEGDQQADFLQDAAHPVLEVGDDLGQLHAGGEADERGAEDEGQEGVELELGDEHHDERDAEGRDHQQLGVVAGPALDGSRKLRCYQRIQNVPCGGRCGAAQGLACRQGRD